VTMDLHPYDNVERRFRHTDPVQDEGRTAVSQVLGIQEPVTGEVFYDLSFFSGGIGVIDHLAITIPADPALWSSVTGALRAWTLEEFSADRSWVVELLVLLTGEEEEAPILPAAVRFINEHRREFQPECVPSNRVRFGYQSDVNYWVALWGDDTRLNYLAYSQG
jgi:hypothetical protein